MRHVLRRIQAATVGVGRGLLRTPIYTISMILSVALGIAGANASYRVFDALVIQLPGGLTTPAELVRMYVDDVGARSPKASKRRVSFPVYRHVAEAAPRPTAFAASWTRPSTAHLAAAMRPIDLTFVTDNYFALLGTVAVRGELFSHPSRQSSHREIVLTSAAVRRLAVPQADPVGATLIIDGVPMTIAGVLHPDFEGLDGEASQAYALMADLPLFGDDPSIFESYGSTWIEVIGRVPSSVDRSALAFALETHLRRLGDIEAPLGRRALHLASLNSALGPERSLADRIVLLLSSLAGLMVVATLLNTLTISATRWMASWRSLSVRTALGASGSDIALTIGIEALVLAVLGGAFGVAMSATTEPLLRYVVATPTGVFHPRVLAVTITCVLLHVPSALSVLGLLRITRLAESLRGASAHIMRSPGTLHRAFLALQIAVAFCLIAGTSGLLRKFRALSNADLGFDPAGLMVLSLASSGMQTRDALLREVIRAASASPMASAAAVADAHPFGNRHLLALRSEMGTRATAVESMVSPDYFATMQIPLLDGRTFTDQEARSGTATAVISRGLSEMLGEDGGVGRCVLTETRRCLRIIGVASDVRQVGLAFPPEPAIYRPLDPQAPEGSEYIVVRVPEQKAVAAFLRDMHRAAQRPGLLQVRSVQEMMEPMLSPWRLASGLVTVLSAAAILLIALGTFAQARLLAQESIRDNALRMLLGAAPHAITIRTFLGGFVLCAVGIALGAVLAFAAHFWMRHAIPFADASRPRDLVISVITVSAATALALIGPAKVASSGRPTELLL